MNVPITYKNLKEQLSKITNMFKGIKIAGVYRAFLVVDVIKIVNTRRNKVICLVDKHDNFSYTESKNLLDLKFFNKYTPISIRMKKKKWVVGMMPFYTGLQVDKTGEYLIPEVFSQTFKSCRSCYDRMTDSHCPHCFAQERRF